MSVNTGLINQRMEAIQAMHKGNFLAFSYVLADNPNQVSQVYNAQFQPGVHHDAGRWHEAKMKNPDSDLAYPMPVFGYKSLSERAQQQKNQINNLVAATDAAKTQISNLKSHTERLILTELANCEKRNKQLSIQLSKLMLQIETYSLNNCKASVDYSKHRQLIEKLEKVTHVLSSLQNKINELRSGRQKIDNQLVNGSNQVAGGSASHGPLFQPTTYSPANLPSLANGKEESSSSSGKSSSFTTLKESVGNKLDAVYSSVIDRCRSVTSAAMHERLNKRSTDYLSQLKRQYLANDIQADSVVSDVPSAIGDKARFPIKVRTMNSFEISALRMISSANRSNTKEEIISLLTDIAKTVGSSMSMLNDVWTLAGYLCAGSMGLSKSSSIGGVSGSRQPLIKLLQSSLEFLENKFASEELGTTIELSSSSNVSRTVDRKQMLFSYCRQRCTGRGTGTAASTMSISKDVSWVWFAVYVAFRSGWSNMLKEIAMERFSGNQSGNGLDVVIECLVDILEGNGRSSDLAKLNTIFASMTSNDMNSSSDSFANSYKSLLLSICKGETESVKISQIIPDCTAYDWLWFSLHDILNEGKSTAEKDDTSKWHQKYTSLVDKISNLPVDYFLDHKKQLISTSGVGSQSFTSVGGIYPNVLSPTKQGVGSTPAPTSNTIHTGKSSEQSRAIVQLALMNLLVLRFDKASQIALKTKNELFDINNPFHKTWLYVSLAFDKFHVLTALPELNDRDAVGAALEAALTIADVKEREMYSMGLSGDSSKKFAETLQALDRRRSTPLPSLK